MTSEERRTVEIAVALPGIATVGGRSAPIDQLHLLLRKQRISGRAHLEISLPKNGQPLCPRIRQTLVKGGYPYVLFKLPRESAAYITPEESRRLRNPLR